MYKVPHKTLKKIRDDIDSASILIELLAKGSKIYPKHIKALLKKLKADIKILNEYDINDDE